ncbi:MAG: T9SS type A sorting domain-containing protein [Bacteroidales bacterium]|nr:T9SS type A sorting domain-containing protein [Bacteroidales bacterium]
MTILKNIIITFAFAAMTLNSPCQTLLPSLIDVDTILRMDLSPYLVNQSMSVNKGCTLIIEPGVTVMLGPSAGITINGNLLALGTPEKNIHFISSSDSTYWRGITSNQGTISLHYCSFSRLSYLLNANGGSLVEVSHCSAHDVSYFSGIDFFATHSIEKVIFEYNNIVGPGDGIKTDATDNDDIDTCIFRYNIIRSFSDDAIDIGTQTVYASIYHNWLSDCGGGITAGEISTVYAFRNCIFNNDFGIQSHHDAMVLIENNTLFNNNYGIECFHSSEPGIETGGKAVVINTIIAQSVVSAVHLQASSQLDVSYSISDTDTLSGEHNIHDDPDIVSPFLGHFELLPGSPCINAGSPESPPDLNGERVDIGAIEYGQSETKINRLSSESEEFLIYPNPASERIYIDLTGLRNKIISVFITDILGKTVLQINHHQFNPESSDVLTIDVKGFPPGYHIITVITDMEIITKKLLLTEYSILR